MALRSGMAISGMATRRAAFWNVEAGIAANCRGRLDQASRLFQPDPARDTLRGIAQEDRHLTPQIDDARGWGDGTLPPETDADTNGAATNVVPETHWDVQRLSGFQDTLNIWHLTDSGIHLIPVLSRRELHCGHVNCRCI